MPTDRKTITADVPTDSDLARQFEEYREKEGMNSMAETTRTLLRAGLDQEFDAPDDERDRDDSEDRDRVPAQTRDTKNELQLQFPALTFPLLSNIALILGSDGLLGTLESVAGDSLGSWIFITFATLLLVWLVVAFRREYFMSDSDDTEAETDVQPRGAD